MINYDYLVKQLRQLNIKLGDIAADEIENLERIAQKQSDELNVLRGSIANYQVGVHEARIAELEAAQLAQDKLILEYCSRITELEFALKPFADCKVMTISDLRQARKVLEGK